jgi:glutathione S-transferase
MALELYWGSGSPFAWRVMLTLEVKRQAYQSTLLEFSRGDHKAAGFLKLNPRGKVPVLKDDDFVLNESLAIMAYLDRNIASRRCSGARRKRLDSSGGPSWSGSLFAQRRG